VQKDRLDKSRDVLQHRVAANVEDNLMEKIKGLHTQLKIERKNEVQSEAIDAMGMLAKIKEYVYNYELSDLPKGININLIE